MISKNSFSSLMKEDMKVKLWLVLMSTILMFLNFPIVMAVMVERTAEFVKQGIYTHKQAVDTLVYYVGGENEGTRVLTVLLACVAAISQFGYLYQRNQVDFYHSLPIRRQKRFLVRFVNGMVLYTVPYLSFCLMGIAVVSAFGYGQMAIVKAALLGFLVNVTGYFLCYATSILAVCLTGNIFTGICGIITLLGYGAVATLFINTMVVKYSQTYMEEYGRVEELCYYISPVSAYWKLSSQVKEPFQLLLWLVGCVSAAVLLTLVALWIYYNRKSESAGMPIAFEKSKGVIKVFIMTLLMGCGTLFFSNLGYNAEHIWEVIGFMVTFVLAQIVLQIIFEMDVRAIKRGLKSAFASSGIVIVIFIGFYFGGKYYDTYQIDWEQMEYVAVYFNNSFSGSYYSLETGSYVSYEECAFENMKINDRELVKNFTIDCIENQKQKKDGEKVLVSLKYTMENGRKIYKNYAIDYNVLEKYILQFWNKKEYRIGTNPIFGMDRDRVEQIKYYDEWSDYRPKYLDMTREEIIELLENYEEEYLNATVEELNECAPVMSFTLCAYEEESGEWDVGIVYVYPSFEKTIAVLENKGMKKKDMENTDISEITVFWWNNEKGKSTKEVEVTYTEPEKIQKVRECLAFEEYGYYTAFDCKDTWKSDYQITVKVVDENGEISQQNAMFIKEVPEWLQEDLKNTEIQQELEKTES